ncbi:MAG: hypothetical protein LBH13_04185 [Cellulomonadaceae bacterium]|jgi:hypothetical protein|nr:hypothetical protein [Cellulomonadaceae bacterium]
MSQMTLKKSVTIPEDVFRETQSFNPNLSEYTTRALRNQIEQDKLATLVEYHESKYGPVSDDVMARVIADRHAADRMVGFVR